MTPHLDAAAAGMLEQYVFRLEVAVDDVQPEECIKALEDGVGHLADELGREAAEVAALQQVVQVDAEQLERDADVRTEDKVLQHVDHVQLVLAVLSSAT